MPLLVLVLFLPRYSQLFSLSDADSFHRIFACTAYGSDWDTSSSSETGKNSKLLSNSTDASVNYQIGWETSSPGVEVGYELD